MAIRFELKIRVNCCTSSKLLLTQNNLFVLREIVMECSGQNKVLHLRVGKDPTTEHKMNAGN